MSISELDRVHDELLVVLVQSGDRRAGERLAGLTLAEVAAAVGVPVGTAKSRIFHARRRLKAALSGDI